MFTVACDSCRASYDLDERRVPEQGMRMRCPKCGTSFMVQRPGGAAAPAPVDTVRTRPGTGGSRPDAAPPPAPPTMFGQRAPGTPDVQDSSVGPVSRTAVGVAPPALSEDSMIVDLPRPKVAQGPLSVARSAPPPAGPSLPRGTLVGAHAPGSSAAPTSAAPAAGAFGASAPPARTLVGNAPTSAAPVRAIEPPASPALPRAPAPPVEPVQDKDLSVSNIRVDQLPMPDAEIDLPAPDPEAVRKAGEVVDLPAVKGTGPSPASKLRTAPGAAPPLGVAPPLGKAPPLGAAAPGKTAVGGGAASPAIVDLPALKGASDLPALKSSADLPALKQPTAFGHADLPAAKTKPASTTADPAAFGNIELPGLGGDGTDLPRLKEPVPGSGTALGVGAGASDLPRLKQAKLPVDESSFGDLELPELPSSGDLPKLKQVQRPADESSFGDLELPELPSSGNLPRLKPAKTTAPDFGGDPAQVPEAGTLAKTAVDEANFADVELPDLPAPRSTLQRPGLDEADFGDIDLPPPKPGGDVLPSKEPTMEGFAGLPRAPVTADFGSPGPGGDSELPPSLLGPEDETSFGDLNMGEAPPLPSLTPKDSLPPSLRDTADEIDMDDGIVDAAPIDTEAMEPQEVEAEPEPDEGASADPYAGASGDAIEAGDAPPRGDGEEMEFGMEGDEEPPAEGKFSLPPEILRRQRGEDFEAKEEQRRRRALTLLIRLGVVGVLVVAAGVTTGFVTNYGMFGLFYWERYFPDAGDPTFARGTIERAEKLALTDTYTDVRNALTELGRARRQKGLNRHVLTRSIVHHGLYMVRFGEDPASASRIAAILRRLEDRGFDAEGMELAFAADAARRKVWDEVGPHLDKARAESRGDDAYLELLAAETAFAQGKLDVAEKAFGSALKAGGGARAQWGLARIALKKDSTDKEKTVALRDEQLAAINETLKLSPMHVEARIAEARIRWLQGQEDVAISELRIAIGLDPTEEDKRLWPAKSAVAAAHSALGYIHEVRGRLPMARQAYDKALEADAYLVEALLGQARVLIRESRYSDSLPRFDSALGVTKGGDNPIMLSGRKADAEANLGKSRALLHLGRSPEARTILAKLTTELPNDAEIVLVLGEVEQALGNHDTAEAQFRKSIELAPATFAGYLALSQHFFKRKEPEKASAILNEAATKVEETAEMRRELGRSELERNKVESAAHEFARALELDPHDMAAMFGLGTATRKLGQLERAANLLDTIASRDPAYGGLVQERGLLAEARGDFAGAVKLYEEALKKEPDDTSLVLRLGAAQLAAGSYDDAEQTLAKVMREMPNSAEAEYFLGRLEFARGRTPDALTHFTRAVTLDGGKAEYHLWVARAALDMANLGRTMEEVAVTLELDPAIGDAYWLRATVESRIGQVKDALKNVEKALKLNPARTEAYAVRGDCFDQLGQLRDAIAAYRTALDREPQRGEWWYKLGRLHMNLGAHGESHTVLKRALELGDKVDPVPYWLPDAYRMVGEHAEAANNRPAAIASYKRYLQIADESHVDRKDIKKKLKDWGIEPPEGF